MSISLQELDAQFSELLPEREALGRMSFSFAHDVPCHPHHHHHHHHCEPTHDGPTHDGPTHDGPISVLNG